MRVPCPLCGERPRSLIDHLRSPAGEGCPETPMGFPDVTAESDEEEPE